MVGAYFWADDFGWLYLIHDRSPVEVLLTPLGGHALVVRNAIFLAVHALAGLDPRPYFWTALATHVVNVVLIARLVWLLTGRSALAGLGAVAYGTCPATAETLGWYSAYGQVAATTCVLAAHVRLAATDTPGARDVVVTTGWLAVATLLFGTGVAAAVVWPATVVLVRPGTPARRLRAVAGATVGLLGLYVAVQATGTLLVGAPAMPLHLLGALARDPWAAVVAGVHLVRVGTASLVLGQWWSPTVHGDRASWAALAVVGATVAMACLRAAPAGRRRLVAYLLLAVTTYALVAAARGPGMREFHALDVAGTGTSFRLHYGAQAALVVALCLALDATVGAPIVALVATVILLAPAARHPLPADLHDDSRADVARALADVRAGIARVPPGGTAWLPDASLWNCGWLPNTLVPLPVAALFVIVFPTDVVDGRTVRFVEWDADQYRRLTTPPDTRLARLVAPPP